MTKQYVRIGNDVIKVREIIGLGSNMESAEAKTLRVFVRHTGQSVVLIGKNAQVFQAWFNKTFADEIEELG